MPAELGGLGGTVLEISQAQQALARGCASTALAVNMHLFGPSHRWHGAVYQGRPNSAPGRVVRLPESAQSGSAGEAAVGDFGKDG